ncbi:MAG: NAD(P)H-dependent oxidoreductase [Myxococcales bacterium]
MKALIVVGSPRTRSNSKALGAYLQKKLESLGASVDLFRLPAKGIDGADLDALVGRMRASDSVVLVAPLYLNGLPASTQRLLEDLADRKEALAGHAPRFYGVSHSGFPEPTQRAPEVRSMQLFAREMGWPWQGALSIGGTSPIDGKPLEEAGMFGKVSRKALDAAAPEIAAGAPFSPVTIAISQHKPIPMPLWALVWLINSRTKSLAKKKGLALFGEPYRA